MMVFIPLTSLLVPYLPSPLPPQRQDHEAYVGDRTKEALVAFADSLIPSAGLPHVKHADLEAAPRSSGCNLAGE